MINNTWIMDKFTYNIRPIKSVGSKILILKTNK